MDLCEAKKGVSMNCVTVEQGLFSHILRATN